MRSLVLVGPRIIPNSHIGGTKVSFECMVRYFASAKDWDPIVVDTSRPNARGNMGHAYRSVATFFRTLASILSDIRSSSMLILNASPRGLIMAGPIIWGLTRLFRRPIVVRVFGGDFDLFYDRSNVLTKAVMRRTWMQSDYLALQTKRLVEVFSPVARTIWLPTSREPVADVRPRKSFKRALFVSQLRKDKGILELLEAFRDHASDLTLTVAGSAENGIDVQVLEGQENVDYIGAVDPALMPKIMNEHDVLIFPSYYEGEGYPGVIIEALMAGMPVIATRWRDLPELVQDGLCGVLVEPGSVESLSRAIGRLASDWELTTKLSKGAIDTARSYSNDSVYAELSEKLMACAKETGRS